MLCTGTSLNLFQQTASLNVDGAVQRGAYEARRRRASRTWLAIHARMKASTSGDWRIFAQSATGRTDVADRSRIGERTIAARNDSRSATGKDSNDPSMMLFRPCRDAEATTPCGGALPQERQDKPAVPSYRA